MPSPSCSLPVQPTVIFSPGEASAGACIVIASAGGLAVGPGVTNGVGVAAAPPHAPTSNDATASSTTNPGLRAPISAPPSACWHGKGRGSARDRLVRRGDLAVALLHVTLEDGDELVDQGVAAERPVEPAVDEDRCDRLLE